MKRIPLRFCPACGAEALQLLNAKQFKCDSCGFVYFQNVAAAAGAILEVEEKILLVKRAKEPSKGLLDLPGGFVDPGETLEEALVRELEEELGLQLEVENCGQYLCSSVNEYPYKGVLYHSLDLFFRVRLEQIPEIKPADDVEGYLWCEPGEIHFEAVAFPSVQDALHCHLSQLR